MVAFLFFTVLCLLTSGSALTDTAATFVVNVTQSSYQAEENHSITLEWTFTTKTQGSYRELFIYCSVVAPHKELIFYQVHEGVEIPDSQDEQFSGRVQSDKDVLREGRIRLHVSRLRTEDSGQYVCEVKTEDGFNNAVCRLNVFEVKLVGQNLIHAKVGDDVILPCHLEPPFDVNRLTIKWRFKGQIILVYHSQAEDDETSDPKYQDRTFMFHDEFKNGNISLKLIKVTKEDEGIYTCFVPNLQSKVRKVNVTLKLGDDPGVIGGGVVGVVVVPLIIIILIIIFITFCVVRRHSGEQIFYAGATTFLKGEMMEGWKQNNYRITEETVTKEMKMKKYLLQEQQNQSDWIIHHDLKSLQPFVVFYARAKTLEMDKGEMMEIGEETVTKETKLKKDLLQEQPNQSDWIIHPDLKSLQPFVEVKDVGQNLIHAKVGDDVILPSHLEPPFDVNRLTIKWRNTCASQQS